MSSNLENTTAAAETNPVQKWSDVDVEPRSPRGNHTPSSNQDHRAERPSFGRPHIQDEIDPDVLSLAEAFYLRYKSACHGVTRRPELQRLYEDTFESWVPKDANRSKTDFSKVLFALARGMKVVRVVDGGRQLVWRVFNNQRDERSERPDRSQDERPDRRQDERPDRRQDERPDRRQDERPDRRQDERPDRSQERRQDHRHERRQDDRPERRQDDRPDRQMDQRRPQGEFIPRHDRRQDERPDRRQDERPDRRQDERQDRRQDERQMDQRRPQREFIPRDDHIERPDRSDRSDQRSGSVRPNLADIVSNQQKMIETLMSKVMKSDN
jgi:hypothetical protein